MYIIIDHGDGVQTMKIDDDDDKHNGNPGVGEDLFTKQLLHFETGTVGTYQPIVVDKRTLISLHREEVIIVKWPTPGIRYKFYRNMMPELPLSACLSCNHFFHEEDFEFEVLKLGKCPFCRVPAAEIH